MSKYGSDKPDVRYGLEMAELADVVAGTEFKLFAGAIESGGVVKAIAVPEGKRISNSRLKPKGDVFNEAIAGGAGGLAFARVGEDGVTLEGGKALCEGLQPVAEKLIARCGASAGDLLLFGAGDEGTVNKALDRVRQFVAKTLDMVPEGQHAVLWITEFPMFEIQRGREQAGGAAPPVHGAQPERRGERRGHQAGQGHRLRSRVQRRGGGRRVAAHLPQGRAGEGV